MPEAKASFWACIALACRHRLPWLRSILALPWRAWWKRRNRRWALEYFQRRPARSHDHEQRSETMQLGMIGLGRMGGNMVTRLSKAGHECLVYDTHQKAVDAQIHNGVKGTTNLPEFVKMLTKPRLIWLMLPAGAVDSVLNSLVAF